jgi:LuxR family maltose regulon positive regulatory protein
MDTQLLTTKLHIPPARANQVPRPRLIEQLSDGLRQGRKLTLISAPAGFGKTTLLSSWVRRIDAAAGWLSLDGRDDDPTRFLRYLGAAFAQAAPDLVVPPVGGPMTSFEPILVPLINDLATLTSPLVLVLDDYHLIENSSIHEALIFLVDNAPPALHLVIATRADPAFPLPRWRARQQLVEIRADDLRFNSDETAAFLQASIDLKLDAGALTALDQNAEGWIAALQLAAASLQGQQDAAAFVDSLSGSHRHILDYLVEEVLQQQPPAVRAFLLQTSILYRLSPPLCDAVLDSREPSAQQMLAQLERDNLFLVPLDNERRWYRFHHLFRDFLRARLGAERPEVVPLLHHRAAEWYAAAGVMDDAVHHVLEAEDDRLAATLIAQVYPSMLQRGEVATLKRWIDALPETLRRSEPELMLAHAWTRAVTLDFEDIEDHLAELEQLVQTKAGLTREERAAGLGEILTIRTTCAFSTGDMDATIAYAEGALVQLPEEDGVLRSVVAHNLANAHGFLGEMEAAGGAFLQAIAEGHRSGNHFLALSARVNLGELRRLQGRWREAEALYREGLAWVKAHQAQPLDGLMHVGLGLIHWDRWEVDAARHHLEVGIDLSRRTGAHLIDVIASSALACLAHHQGSDEEALGWLERTVSVARRLNYAEVVGFAELWEARYRIARGDRGALAEWMAHRQPLDRLSADTRAFEAQVVAHARLALGDAQGALVDLARVRQQAEAAGWVQRLVEALVLEAQTHETLGRRSQALGRLEPALERAQSGGFARPFVEAGDAIFPLLHHVAAADLGPGQRAFLETILVALDVTVEAAPAAPALIEPLTERELEVLRLLSTELTTAEIAERLVISYHTARTHIKHIYGKLDAHSRHEAVSRAETLNLL